MRGSIRLTTALLGAGLCAATMPSAGRAAEIDVSQNTGLVAQFFVGPTIMMPGATPIMAPLTMPAPYFTPSGDFEISMSMLTAANVAGKMITYSVTAKVTDLTGVRDTLGLRVDQAFDVLASNFVVTTPTLMATFANVGGGVHGNEIRATLSINGETFGPMGPFTGPFVVQDSGGSPQTVAGPSAAFSVANPMTITTPLDFEFEGTPVAGDAESVPFSVTVQVPNLVPEPGSAGLLVAAISLLGVGVKLGSRSRRRRG